MGQMAVEVRVLGPVEAERDGVRVELGAPQQRALLALLALSNGNLLTTDAIVDALWPEAPPPSAAKIVQTYVSRLRRALGETAIERRGAGYKLAEDVAIDVKQFEKLTAEGDPRAALDLWRGSPFADVPRTQPLQVEADRLEEQRLRAIEDRIDRELDAGRHREVVPELQALVAANPLRERPVGQLMVALYGSGRQAEALEAYRRARHTLVDELAIEPGAPLRDLERRILEQDPSLLPPEQHPESPRRPTRTWLLAAIALAVVLSATGAYALARDDGPTLALGPNTIVRIDSKTNEIVQSIGVGRLPGAIVATDRHVWVVNERDGTLSRVNTETGASETIGGLPSVGFLAVDTRGNVYASGWDAPFVWRIDGRRVAITKRFRVKTRAIGLAVGGGSLWVVDRLANAVSRIDLATARVEDSVAVGADPLRTAFGFGALWVANSDDATVSVIRPGVAEPETVPVEGRPFGIDAGEGAVWVGSNSLSQILRVDADTRRVVERIGVSASRALPSGLFDVVAGAGAVWGANWAELTLVRIDPETNRVVARIKLPGAPRGIAVAGDDVWVSLGVPGAEFP
jgi:YVTN family beta-propeller protein